MKGSFPTMETRALRVDSSRITSIIQKRLVSAPSEVRETFPKPLLEDGLSWEIISADAFLMVDLVTQGEAARLQSFRAQRLNPFLGLITTEDLPAAFKLDKSQFVSITGCFVQNVFTFAVGRDSTVVLEDHHISLNTTDRGIIEYTLPLVYLVVYGDEIDITNCYDYLDSIVADSVDSWRRDRV